MKYPYTSLQQGPTQFLAQDRFKCQTLYVGPSDGINIFLKNTVATFRVYSLGVNANVK